MVERESQQDIDRHVDRLLRAAGARYRFPTPVDDLVAVQKLALPLPAASPFAPAILAEAPPMLREMVRRFQYKIAAALDRRARRVYLSPDRLEVQKRLDTCHEVSHDLLPWHRDLYYIDSAEHLDPTIDLLMEQEANYAGIQLLLQQNVFWEVASDYPCTAETVKDLAARFGASIHATFWHYVETNPNVVAGFVLGRSPMGPEPGDYRFSLKKAFGSSSFRDRFRALDELPAALCVRDHPDLLPAWDRLRRFDIPGEGQMCFVMRDGEAQQMRFELFSNHYNLLLLVAE